jgi:hypothetical protein
MSQHTDAYSALQVVKDGLADPQSHFLVKAHYYEHDGRVWYLAVIHLHQSSAWDLLLEGEGFSCQVLLNRLQPRNKCRISIPYNQVWHIIQGSSSKFDSNDCCLYSSEAVFLNYPLAAECIESTY